MKNIFLCSLVLLLVGCNAETIETTSDYKLPKELNDCKFYYLQGGGTSSKNLYVVRCPSSSTSTNWDEPQGKTTTTNSVTAIN